MSDDDKHQYAEDEAYQIACMLWDGRMLPDHAAAAIRALVRRRTEACPECEGSGLEAEARAVLEKTP